MNHEQLSKRLQTVASHVPKGARLADIGSDHAYLPCYLALQNHISYALAGEVVKGPYELACKHVAQLGLSQMITPRLADGLMAIESSDDIDTVTICGMGGDLIASILEKGKQHHKLESVTTIIAQPNVDAIQVRKWLMLNGYAITCEHILEENGKIYELIVAKPSATVVQYTPDELQFGVYLLQEKSDVFKLKWQNELEKYDKIIASLQHAKEDMHEKVATFERLKDKISEVIR